MIARTTELVMLEEDVPFPHDFIDGVVRHAMMQDCGGWTAVAWLLLRERGDRMGIRRFRLQMVWHRTNDVYERSGKG